MRCTIWASIRTPRARKTWPRPKRCSTSIKPSIRYFHSSQYIDDLGNGEICLALGYSGDIFIASDAAAQAAQATRSKYLIPKEGAATLFDFLAIPVDAPHPDNALKFINYILEPKVVAAITNYVFYANPNIPALEFVNEEVKSNPGIYPPAETIAKAFVMKAHSPEFEEGLDPDLDPHQNRSVIFFFQGRPAARPPLQS